jgi:toxin-antitoxin system PIN domain toxin
LKTALLDTNVLLALAWPNHQHHGEAHRWFAHHADGGWATCAFTQLGFVRLSANPAYSRYPVPPADAATLLLNWTKHKGHRFWSSPPAQNRAIFTHALGHQQVNDAWLIHVTRFHKGSFVTFDSRLTVHAGGEALVKVIEAGAD